MDLPLDIQKYILSFLAKNPEFTYRKKGRCICKTQTGERCLRKVNYVNRLSCFQHDKIENIFSYR